MKGGARTRVTRTTQAALLASVLLFLGCLVPLLPALPLVAFLPGRTLESPAERPIGDSSTGQMPLAVLDLVIKILLSLLLIGVVLLLYRLSSRTAWKAALLLLVSAGVAYLLLTSTSDEPVGQPLRDPYPSRNRMVSSENADQPNVDELPPLDARSLDHTRALDTLLALFIAISALTIIVSLIIARRRQREPPPEQQRTIMESIARATHRILAGEHPQTVVLRCYWEMLTTLSAKQRIDPTCLTPREFTRHLQQAGLSDDHVAELTGIFEIVRYGDQVDVSFAPRAMACLQSIQEAHVGKNP